MQADADHAAVLLVESLQAHFGAAWRWSEMAAWIEARALAELPRMWTAWARDYQATRRLQLSLAKEESYGMVSEA